MSFAASIRNRNSERLIALAAAVSLLLSLMVVYASPAQAHNGTVTWDCTGWSIDLNNYVDGADITVIVDGVEVDSDSDWTNYDNSGTWSTNTSHSLRVVVDAYDDADQPVYNRDDDGSFSPAWRDGEWSFTLNASSQPCVNPGCPTGYLELTHDPVTGGTDGPFTIDLGTENNGAPDGQTFDWTSTVPVYRVVVKGGPGSNIYDYSGAFSDEGLHAPVNPNNGNYYGLSHITFCYEEPDEPVETNFSIGGSCDLLDQVAEFTISGSLGEGLTLEVGGETIDTAGPYSVDVGAAGDYDYTVSVDEGFVLAGGAPSTEGTISIDDCTPPQVDASTTFTIGGSCELVEDVAEFTISGNLGEGLTLEVGGQTIDTAGPYSVDVGAAGSYDYVVSVDEGFALAEGSPAAEGTISIDDCTPPQPPPSGWACVDGDVVFIDDATDFQGVLYPTEEDAAEAPGCAEVDASTTFTIGGSCEVVGDVAEFTISGNLGEGLTLEVAGQTIDTAGAYSIDVGAAGSYDYTVSVDEGFALAEQSPEAEGTITIGDCTDQVRALVIVTVSGVCILDGDDGVGVIDVTMSVTGGANVVVRNSSGSVVGSFSDDGSVEVPEGAAYTWEATPNEGFEFASDFDSTGSISIETCSNPETLPFTGLDADVLAALSVLLLGSGMMLLLSQRRREES